MLPERLARGCPGLQAVDAPLAVPGYEIAMLWHERQHRDPNHQWLRDHIADTARTLAPADQNARSRPPPRC
jgi:DNA-binding transcriptional LysR family regulator